jgi:hypothetical protein
MKREAQFWQRFFMQYGDASPRTILQENMVSQVIQRIEVVAYEVIRVEVNVGLSRLRMAGRGQVAIAFTQKE